MFDNNNIYENYPKIKNIENVFKEYEQATYNDVTRFSYFGIQILYKKNHY